jgi:hypothetical protein
MTLFLPIPLMKNVTKFSSCPVRDIAQGVSGWLHIYLALKWPQKWGQLGVAPSDLEMRSRSHICNPIQGLHKNNDWSKFQMLSLSSSVSNVMIRF